MFVNTQLRNSLLPSLLLFLFVYNKDTDRDEFRGEGERGLRGVPVETKGWGGCLTRDRPLPARNSNACTTNRASTAGLLTLFREYRYSWP